MNRSFIDRLFPYSSRPLLPQHEQTEPLNRKSSRSPASPPRIRLQENVPPGVSSILYAASSPRSSLNTSASPSVSSETQSATLQGAPLSASVLHHDDPLLPIQRASKALQDTIQSLLDIQSRALSGRIHGVEQEDMASGGSLTPTQSVVTPRSTSGMRTVPIRQPVKKNMSLRNARKSLSKKMRDFAELREEELQVLDTEMKARTSALERIHDFETRREACVVEIEQIRGESTSATVSNLRAEAKNVESEIEELEHKLLELRVRHRHLMSQADQVESSLASKLSSFQGSLAMVDKEVHGFLRRPPIVHALATNSATNQLGMYALKPERRTLDMAKEQWSSEKEFLSQRKIDVEHEYDALVEGEHVWSEAVKRINDFEKGLRAQTALLSTESSGSHESSYISIDAVIHELDTVSNSLESDLSLAESKSWNLLVCAIGAELEAFHQAREMLTETKQIATGFNSNIDNTEGELEEAVPDHPSRSPNGSVASNQSLQDTLKEFSNEPNTTAKKVENVPPVRYESEDDEPPVDFLLSR